MQPTIALFDIDGTLIHSAGAGRRALDKAFAAHCGRPDACEGIDFAGMTDPAIVQQALTRIGLEPSPEACRAVLDRYLGFLDAEVAAAEGYALLPGVRPLLDRLSGRPGLALGLGTGNLEPGARSKLARAGLNPYFAFGGYGSDAAERHELLVAGWHRGAARLGRPPADCRVVVIGDTPRDVAAGRAIGATCVAVATGGASLDALRATGPDLLLPDLGDGSALLRALGAGEF